MGVFLKVNASMLNMLRSVQPYVAYGYPTLKTVRNLVYKRGYGKINKQRIPLDDNAKVHASLGKFGISCMEDLIHEIYTGAPISRRPTISCGPSSSPTPPVVGRTSAIASTSPAE